MNSGDPVAPVHVREFNKRSVFLVMLRVPAEHKTGIAYLRQLSSAERPWIYTKSRGPDPREVPELRADLPQFPTNTTWTLVRRMCLIDTNGEIEATPITELIQVRRYLNLSQDQTLSALAGRAPVRSQETF